MVAPRGSCGGAPGLPPPPFVHMAAYWKINLSTPIIVSGREPGVDADLAENGTFI